MKKKNPQDGKSATGADPRREIFPLNEKQEMVHKLEELEARLETQNIPLEPTGIWSCNPVNTCDYDCGGGHLCDIHCPCNLLI